MLATLGALTCSMRGNIGEVVAAPGGSSFILGILDEVVRIVSAVGEALTAPFLESARKTLSAGAALPSPRAYAASLRATGATDAVGEEPPTGLAARAVVRFVGAKSGITEIRV